MFTILAYKKNIREKNPVNSDNAKSVAMYKSWNVCSASFQKNVQYEVRLVQIREEQGEYECGSVGMLIRSKG